MSVMKGFAIVIASGLGFAIGGGLIGYALAVVAPAYYRGVFQRGSEPWFDPVAVGVGLGVSQGLLVGLLVGAVVLIAVSRSKTNR
jgi:hypothetical protein